MADKKTTNEPPTQEAFYVALRRPLELRRHILEGSKMVIFSLQNYNNLTKLREEKTKKIALLKVQVGEVNLLCAKLAEFLPDYHLKLREEMEEADKKRKKRRKKGSKHDEPLTKMEEIDKLESSLQHIESKLNRIT